MLEFIKANRKYIAIIVVIVFLGGFWAGYDYKAREIRNAFIDAFSGIADDYESTFTDEPIITDEDEDYDFISYKVGETVEYAAQTMRVNSILSKSKLKTDYFESLEAGEGAKFIIINHTVTNTTDAPFSYEGFNLFDGTNRRYNAFNDGYIYLDDALYYRELSPDVPETGEIIFKVPASTTDFRFGGNKGDTITDFRFAGNKKGATSVLVVDFKVE